MVCQNQTVTKHHKKVHSVTKYDSSDSSDDFFIGMVQCGDNKSPNQKVAILVNHQKTCFKIDTGAQCNAIPKQKYHQLSSERLL